MLRNMIEHYHALSAKSPHAAAARDYEAVLRDDESRLLEGIQQLRFSVYVKGDVPGKPPHYDSLIAEPTRPLRSEPYLYSSRRYRIPFGWYANPIPSTAATAWVILVADEYDPFGYGGRPN
jgi:hypothetical protein